MAEIMEYSLILNNIGVKHTEEDGKIKIYNQQFHFEDMSEYDICQAIATRFFNKNTIMRVLDYQLEDAEAKNLSGNIQVKVGSNRLQLEHSKLDKIICKTTMECDDIDTFKHKVLEIIDDWCRTGAKVLKEIDEKFKEDEVC